MLFLLTPGHRAVYRNRRGCSRHPPSLVGFALFSACILPIRALTDRLGERMEHRNFTPEEAESTFRCHTCGEHVLRPDNPTRWEVIEAVRDGGLTCKYCLATNSDDFLSEIMSPDGTKTWAPAYSEYLASPQWQVIRRLAIGAADGRCQICNSDLLLQVHHRRYPNVLGWEQLSDLTVLCRRCHDLFHNAKGAK